MKPIGILIKEELKRQERSISWFARKLACDRTNVYRMFQRESIDTGVLARISLILNHDFFADYSAYIAARQTSSNPLQECNKSATPHSPEN